LPVIASVSVTDPGEDGILYVVAGDGERGVRVAERADYHAAARFPDMGQPASEPTRNTE
jgi:hypothetical protein